MITNLSISRRLTLGFALLVILNMAASVGVIVSLRAIRGNVSEISQDALPSIERADRIHTQTLAYRVLTNRHILSDNAADQEAIGKQCDALALNLLDELKACEKIVAPGEEHELFAKIEPALNDFRAVAKQIRALSAERKDQEAIALLRTDGARTFDAFEKAVVAFAEHNTKDAETQVDDIQSATQQSLFVITIFSIVSAVIAIAAGYLITRGINKRLQVVSQGLGDGAAQVSSASGQVSAASQSLAEGSSEQAASLEETSSSLEEMASMTRRNAEGAQQAKTVSNNTRSAAQNGAVKMEEMRTAMDAIKTSSNDIAKIIKTIDEIAFQTNILALNAAVEAARAGEAGAGFAVVADEVRALAQRAAQAAKETEAKIQDAIQKSEHGVVILGSVAQSLNEIVEGAVKVDTFVAEIATASNEQNQGIEQLNTAVSQMDKVTQSNASNAEETAAAAEELNAQAMSMKESVLDLQALIGGSGLKARGQQAEEHVSSRPVRPAVASRSAKPATTRRAAPPARELAAAAVNGSNGNHDSFFE